MPVTTDAEKDTVEIRYQATASENTEDLSCALMRSLVRELATVL
jgi:hypothetical protein